jgi:predicted small lipoprotein YifL
MQPAVTPRVWVLWLACAALVAGCGQKGPLYLPDPQRAQVPAATPAATPAAPADASATGGTTASDEDDARKQRRP